MNPNQISRLIDTLDYLIYDTTKWSGPTPCYVIMENTTDWVPDGVQYIYHRREISDEWYNLQSMTTVTPKSIMTS